MMVHFLEKCLTIKLFILIRVEILMLRQREEITNVQKKWIATIFITFLGQNFRHQTVTLKVSYHTPIHPCIIYNLFKAMCLPISLSDLFTGLFHDCFPVLCYGRSSISPQGSLKFHLIHLSDHPSIHPSVHTPGPVRSYLCSTFHLTAA